MKYPPNWFTKDIYGYDIDERIDLRQPRYPRDTVGASLIFSVKLGSLDEIIATNKATPRKFNGVKAWRYQRKINPLEKMILIEEVLVIPGKNFYVEVSRVSTHDDPDRVIEITHILSTFKFIQ